MWFLDPPGETRWLGSFPGPDDPAAPSSSLILRFDRPVDADEILAAATLDPPVPLRLATPEERAAILDFERQHFGQWPGGFPVILQPTESLPEGVVTVTLAATDHAPAARSTFDVHGPPSLVEATCCGPGGLYDYVHFTFDQDIDPSRLDLDRWTLDPPTADVMLLDEAAGGVILLGWFEPGTTTITIPADLSDTSGQTLGHPVEVAVEIPKASGQKWVGAPRTALVGPGDPTLTLRSEGLDDLSIEIRHGLRVLRRETQPDAGGRVHVDLAPFVDDHRALVLIARPVPDAVPPDRWSKRETTARTRVTPSSMAVTLVRKEGEDLVWVTDEETGAPLEHVRVRGRGRAATDGDGVALVHDARARVVLRRPGERVVFHARPGPKGDPVDGVVSTEPRLPPPHDAPPGHATFGVPELVAGAEATLTVEGAPPHAEVDVWIEVERPAGDVGPPVAHAAVRADDQGRVVLPMTFAAPSADTWLHASATWGADGWAHARLPLRSMTAPHPPHEVTVRVDAPSEPGEALWVLSDGHRSRYGLVHLDGPSTTLSFPTDGAETPRDELVVISRGHVTETSSPTGVHPAASITLERDSNTATITLRRTDGSPLANVLFGVQQAMGGLPEPRWPQRLLDVQSSESEEPPRWTREVTTRRERVRSVLPTPPVRTRRPWVWTGVTDAEGRATVPLPWTLDLLRLTVIEGPREWTWDEAVTSP
ncbi:MAG: hypothetical protein H6738_24680 [Alphaproteobacteria bacterium]|nr:hypothetical protein [Alphaproteobacteria bacterium]